MGDPDRGNLFSAWFVFGFGEAVELVARAIPLSICPRVGRPALLLGSEFASCLFSEEWPFWNPSSRCCPSHSLTLPWWLPLPVPSATATPSGSAGLRTPDKSYYLPIAGLPSCFSGLTEVLPEKEPQECPPGGHCCCCFRLPVFCIFPLRVNIAWVLSNQ